MACNIPVITTRYGSLQDIFSEDEDLQFVDSFKEVLRIIDSPRKKICKNRKKILPFTWETTAMQISNYLEH